MFTSEPYRILLAFGTIQLIVVLVPWNIELIGRLSGVQSFATRGASPGDVHALLMLYTLFPFFVFGFLMTTYPRWLNAPPVRRSGFLPAAAMLGAGVWMFGTGIYASESLRFAGLLVFLCGYLLAVFCLWDTQRRGRIHGRLYERYLSIALLLGFAGLLVAVAALHGRAHWWPVARTLGLWGFLTPVLVTMSHRMLPFLTSCVAGTDPVAQPRGGPHAMLLLIALHGLLELSAQWQWLWLVDLPLALIAAYHLRCWAFARCLRARLLTMFHVAFAWFVVAMLLYAAGSLQLFLGGPNLLARAPLHALGIGFALGMTLAMVARIARVHAGLTAVAAPPVWFAFWMLNAAALLRIGAELFPVAELMLLSGLALGAAILFWAAHCLPLLVKP